MKNNFLALLFIGGAAFAAEPAPSEALAAKIARVESGLLPAARIAGAKSAPWTIESRMKFYKIPGVSIAVINGGAIEWARGYGNSRASDDAIVTTDTLFQAASISKPVTAVGALTLVDAGKLTLDADVNATLTSWKLPAVNVVGDERATLRRLLSHTAGVTVHGFEGYAPDQPRPTLLQVLDGIAPANSAAVRIDFTPGTKWRYAGGGYCVVQQLMLDVTGEDFPAFMRTHVLAPAGMTASTYEQPLPAALTPHAAAGHRADGKIIPGDAHVYPEMAAAGLWTTSSDLARFALALQHVLEGRDGLLSAATAKQILQVPVAGSDYGLGLGVKGAGENLQLSHGGANEGFCCTLVTYPFAGRGAVIMTNSDNGSALATEILRALAQEYDWPDYRVIEKTAAPLSSKAFTDFMGRYERESTLVQVFQTPGHFFLKFGSKPRVEIYPQSDHEFFLLDEPDSFSFERNSRGEVTHMIRRGSSPQLYRRLN
jgi:CubicO group peptidase (beta-lactamase class C family)